MINPDARNVVIGTSLPFVRSSCNLIPLPAAAACHKAVFRGSGSLNF